MKRKIRHILKKLFKRSLKKIERVVNLILQHLSKVFPKKQLIKLPFDGLPPAPRLRRTGRK
jgi:hypothetical protein